MSKKKIAKKIIIPIVLLVMIASAVCFFAVNKKSPEAPPSVSHVNQNNDITTIENKINTDVINQNVCYDYNGNYVYKSIRDVSFNKEISSASETLTYEYISGYPDKNTFLYFLNKQKKAETKNEILTFLNGCYTKTVNSSKAAEGIYYGNSDKSYVYIESENGSIEIDETKYSIELEISFTAYWLEKPPTPSSTKIYVREKYIYDELASNFLYVTYVYEMITD